MDRRSTDPRLIAIEKTLTEHIDAEDAQRTLLAEMRVELAQNTLITNQVREILTTFATTARIAKWVSTVGGAVAVCWAAAVFGWDQIVKYLSSPNR